MRRSGLPQCAARFSPLNIARPVTPEVVGSSSIFRMCCNELPSIQRETVMIKRTFGRRNRGAWYIPELASDGSTIETWPVAHYQNIKEWGRYVDHCRSPVASQRWLDWIEAVHVVFQR